MLHIRLSRITAGPPALDECVAYIEREARPALEARMPYSQSFSAV